MKNLPCEFKSRGNYRFCASYFSQPLALLKRQGKILGEIRCGSCRNYDFFYYLTSSGDAVKKFFMQEFINWKFVILKFVKWILVKYLIVFYGIFERIKRFKIVKVVFAGGNHLFSNFSLFTFIIWGKTLTFQGDENNIKMVIYNFELFLTFN